MNIRSAAFALFFVSGLSVTMIPVNSPTQVPTVLQTDTAVMSGSGVVVKQDGDKVYILSVKHGGTPETVGGFEVIENHEHPQLDARIVVVRTEQQMQVAVLGDEPSFGDPLRAIGYHLGSWKVMTGGFAGETYPGWGEMTCPIIYGASGGAVIDEKNELIGIVDSVAQITDNVQGITVPIPHLSAYTPISDLLPWMQAILD